ncbi:MAG: calcium-binding protein [Rhizobiaceae bacterium]|nr:calcium-binding protein [Rhizobiaceae bacterium]
MARRINGTNGNDRIEQNGRPELDIRAFGGKDTIILDRDDDLGGNNRVNAGDGNDTVLNTFEGGNVILLGKGNDIYIGTGFSQLGGFDIVEGGAGKDQFFLKTFKSVYRGGEGKDSFFSDGWQNDINGGGGSDTISYQFRHEDRVIGDTGVTIDLAAGAAQTGAARFENLTSIENAIGSEHRDRIGGTDGRNVLTGLGGDDDIFGFGGKDVLIGGRGRDLLFGGSDADRFVFEKVADSTLAQQDRIADFNRADGDIIDLSAIDAVAGRGNQAFNFIGGDAFSGVAGQLRFSGDQLLGDVNGDGVADFAVEVDLDGQTPLQASDFIL